MPLLDELWGNLQGNYTDKTEWLRQAFELCTEEIRGIKQRLDRLEAEPRNSGNLVDGEAKGAAPSNKANGQQKPDLNKYPKWGKRDRVSKLHEHFKALNGEPSDEACEHILDELAEGPYDNKALAKKLNCSLEKATAWTYILQKRGSVIWDSNESGYSLNE